MNKKEKNKIKRTQTQCNKCKNTCKTCMYLIPHNLEMKTKEDIDNFNKFEYCELLRDYKTCEWNNE